jgi:hypothetical protein
MKDKQLEQVLKRLADGMVPSEMDMWPGIQTRFKKSKSYSQLGATSMHTQFEQKRRLRLATVLIGAVLILAALLVITPQGRALAQEFLQFFSRAETDTLPAQSEQLLPVSSEPDPASILDANLEVLDVQEQAGFDVLEPAFLPQVLTFSGASIEPEHHIVRIFYREVETNGLVLRQESYQTSDDCELCGVVGDSAVIETVQIGNSMGEYVEGVWNLTDEGQVWVSDPYLKTMRWQANGLAFELMFMGSPDSVTREDMIAIAESLK